MGSRLMPLIYLLVYLTTASSENVEIANQRDNFYSRSTLNDGVHQTLVYLNGIMGAETIAGPKEGSPRGLVSRQVSNGKQVVSLIYNGVPPYLAAIEGPMPSVDATEPPLLGAEEEELSLRDCNVDKDENRVDEFTTFFGQKAFEAEDGTIFDLRPSAALNSTFVTIDPSTDNLPDEVLHLTRFKYFKGKCFELKRAIRKILKKERKRRMRLKRRRNKALNRDISSSSATTLQRKRRGLGELLILPGTKWCGNGRLAKSYNDLDGYHFVDNCCRNHDLCPTTIRGLSRKYGLYNYRLTTISHCYCDKRRRRGVTNILSIPHTKWCGAGDSAMSYEDLGGLFGADICCRQHDLHCPYFIKSFQRKFGYFHFGFGTVSHCSCDRRFKTCLKQTGTGASDLVGNMFFNIVQSSCFVFKRKKVCKKRGLWSCQKWGYEKQAVMRDPIKWNW